MYKSYAATSLQNKAAVKELFEVEIEEGNLVCANCGREYMIKRGIPDMVLKDDEI